MRKGFLLLILFLSCLIFAEYTLRTGDIVRIEVFAYPEMTKDCLVDSDGYISYAGVGRIKVEGMTLSDIEKIASEKIAKLIPNPSVTVSLISYAPRYIYIQGITNRRIDIGINPVTLSQVISTVGSNGNFNIDSIDLENIRIFRREESFIVNLSAFYEGSIEADVPVFEGDIIYIPSKSPISNVKVLGAVKNPSSFSYIKGMTLAGVISLAGGVITNVGDLRNVYLSRNGTVQKIDLEAILTGKNNDLELKPGDQIYVPKIDLRYAYVTGFVAKPGIYEFMEDEPITLKRLIAKAGGVQAELKYIEKITVTQSTAKKDYSPSVLSEGEDILLESGAYVDVVKKQERFVYVLGLVKNQGRIDFQPEESMKLSVLIAKAGGFDSPQVEKGGTIKIYRDGSWYEIQASTIKEKDIDLEPADLVRVEYQEFYVYVVGNLATSGKIIFEPEEPKKLSTLINKVGQISEQTFESIQLIQPGQTQTTVLKIHDVLDGLKDEDLQNGATVVFKLREGRYVYFIGDLSQFITFNFDEKITLKRALSKANLNLDLVEQLCRVSRNSEEPIQLEPDIVLESGDIIKVTLKKPARVSVLGRVKVPGQVVFEVNERSTLRNAIAKCGGFITEPTEIFVSDKVIVYSEGKRHLFSVDQVESEEFNFFLKDGDFVYVTEKSPHYVFVFGDAVKNEKILLSHNEEFKLSTVLGKITLVNDARQVHVIYPTNESTLVSLKDIQIKKADLDLIDGTFIVIEKDLESYIYVLGMVKNPGGYYISDRQITALEALSLSGGISDWGSYNQIILKRGNESKTINAADPIVLNSISVKAGDILYVPPIESNVVYVLGQVSKPGLVRIDQYSTVMDAIMKCGGFTTRAIASRVYLFKGGPTGEPVLCDLSGTLKGKSVASNPNVSPGDVIFVPDNPLMNIVDMIPIIQDLISIISDVQGMVQ
ncbi:SLBB domain-containing protein [Pseudothermotoga elfii]|jgi:protein involved in polysaccharide export with SLBB domain